MSLGNVRIRSQNLVFTCDSLRSNDVAFSVFHLSLSPKSSNQSTNFKQWRISESRLVLNLVNDRWFDNHFLDLVVTEREPIQSPLLMKCFETGFASCCFRENLAFLMPVKFLIRYSWKPIIFFSISWCLATELNSPCLMSSKFCLLCRSFDNVKINVG